MANGAELYGQGIGFPPQVGPNGQMVWSAGEPNVREAICIILRTRPGERLMRPDFGCGLDRFLFEPNSTGTLRLIQEEVKRALTRWEPRIAVAVGRLATDSAGPRAVDRRIAYTRLATRWSGRVGLTLALQA